MRIELPDICVVALIGASGSGKSTFAKRHFKPTEVLGSDAFRAMISDDENDQSATQAAFDSLYYIAGKRLDAGRLTVIDATNVQKTAREKVLALAREQNVLAVAIVFDMPEELCQSRNALRPDRDFGPHVVRNHVRDLNRSLRFLQKEGFRYVYIIKTPEEAEDVEIVRTKLWNDRREDAGPFDIIGDIHGCYDELCELLERLNYTVNRDDGTASPPEGRKAVFLGDLCDRGPKNAEVLRLVMNLCGAGHAYCVPGNHDMKLLKKLKGADVQLSHGLEVTARQLEAQSQEFREEVKRFLDGLVSHYVLDGGKLVVAHAGLKEKYQGRSSSRVRSFCLYGETNGETDEYGLPVRLDWASEYRGRARVVFGHTPSREVQLVNNTVCIDTGCVFGGKLTAYRYPEGVFEQVSAMRTYYAPAKPLKTEPAQDNDLLNISDVMGKRIIETGLQRSITVREENAAAALEIMSRFAADPHWLIYLPPTMSPCETSRHENYLEHPLEAFAYYAKHGVNRVVCERKHMGSRAVLVLCRDAQSAAARFGVGDGSDGLIHTRTGRHFFESPGRDTENELLSRLRAALDRSGFWEAFGTDWVCLDAELMPWSTKARGLLIDQYAPTGRAGREGLARSIEALETAIKHGTSAFEVEGNASGQNADLKRVAEDFRARREAMDAYVQAYRRYCWPVSSVDDYRIAPFHILATEGKVWSSESHIVHMDTIRQYMTGADPLLMATEYIVIDVHDEASVQTGVDWWANLTENGGEGMVVKPLDFTARFKGSLIQPAIKCRGREYLRIIYGPEYLLGEHLNRLKKRSLGKKRKLALSEFALGMEALERFVNKEPLYRVHECVFAVLALESEPVDPRL